MSKRRAEPELRVIFLDIDGVLTSDPKHPSRDGNHRNFSTQRVEILNRIIELTGAVIVVSSVWRLGSSVIRLQRILNEQGVKGLVIDRTSNINHSVKKDDAPERPEGEHWLVDYRWEKAPRGEEMQQWLDDRAASYPDEKVNFVILDDDRDVLHLKPHFIWTGGLEYDFCPGLTWDHVEPAVKLLKGITW